MFAPPLHASSRNHIKSFLQQQQIQLSVFPIAAAAEIENCDRCLHFCSVLYPQLPVRSRAPSVSL